jgi:AraC family transcriptional regulator
MGRRLCRVECWEQLARQALFQPGDMAALCHVSLRQLERHFLREFGTSPGKWSRELRRSLACKLLSQGWSNKAIVSELGFANNGHLCQEFKRSYGKSPQMFSPSFRVS